MLAQTQRERAIALGGASALNTHARRGLAPLELVLSLFFLLVLMALIINFGTIASWRVRGNTAARYGAWRTIAIRTGSGYPNPPNWQVRGATMGVAPAMPVNPNVINQVWSQNDLMQPALRGPSIVDPMTGHQIMMSNQQQYMEMTNNALIGSANLTKTLPLLPNLRKSYIQPLHPVVNHFWRFTDMFGVAPPPGVNPNTFSYMRNGGSRLFRWYLFEAGDLPDGDLMEAFMQFQMADQAIQQNPGSAQLLPLDRDDEFIAWRGPPPPDFYPSCNGCEKVPTIVKSTNDRGVPRGLISRIEGRMSGGRGGVPDAMASAFIGLYQQQIQFYQQQQPPDQQMISQLQQKIQQLQQFQGTLF